MKTIRRKDKTEFGSVHEGEFHTHLHPTPLNDNDTIDELKKYCIDDVDWDKYEIIDVTFTETDEIGADIRNKLSPLKNLICLLERQKEVDNGTKIEIQKYIDWEIEQSKISIDYLTKIL